MHPYLTKLNRKETNPVLVSLRQYAEEFNVPIIQEEGIAFLTQLVLLKDAKHILEIGTAIGYSSIALAIHTNANIVTIERNEEMYQKAIKNIEDNQLSSRITVIFEDALDVDESKLDQFDLIFIDAAKAQSIKFFEKYETRLTKNGVIVTDNLLFHDLVTQEIKDRNLRQLTTKIDRFNHYVVSREDYQTYLYDIGDGMSVSIKKE